MLNLKSTDKELFKELKEDYKGVKYWHVKHFGGTKGYDRYQDKMLTKVKYEPAETERIGELVDYHSLKTGNRWKSFELASSYGVGNCYTRMFSFCYFDTFGSVGSFFYMVQPHTGKHTVLVFPSHFFLRYADRMGIQHRDAALVSEFYIRNHVMMPKLSEEQSEKGKRTILIAVKEGVCYGETRTAIENPEDVIEKDNVFEIRTFLTYEQLNGRQKKEVEELKEISKEAREYLNAPLEHQMYRAVHDREFNEKIIEDMSKQYGLTKEEYIKTSRIQYAVFECTVGFDEITKKIRGTKNWKALAEFMSSNRKLLEATLRWVKNNPGNYKPSNLDIAMIVHDAYGDEYDWGKWLIRFMKVVGKFEDDEMKKYVEEVIKYCRNNQVTFEGVKFVLG